MLTHRDRRATPPCTKSRPPLRGRHCRLWVRTLIFKLPPTELGVHSHDKNDVHELYLICDDLDATMARLAGKGVACSEPATADWGRSTSVPLPGGGKIGLYEAYHARP